MDSFCFGSCSLDIDVVREELFEHGGVDVTGTDGVDTNAFGSMVDGHGLGDHVDRTLGGAVGGELRVGHVAVVASEVDDRRPRRLAQHREGVLGREVRAGHVDREDAFPFGQRGLFDGLLNLDTSRVHHDVQATVGGLDVFEPGDHGRLVGYIEVEKLARGRCVTDRSCLVEVGGVHGRALTFEASTNRSASASSSTGYQRYSTVDRFGHVCILR